jgi:hypothetical protein
VGRAGLHDPGKRDSDEQRSLSIRDESQAHR